MVKAREGQVRLVLACRGKFGVFTFGAGSGRWGFLDQYTAQEATTTIIHIPSNAHTLINRCHSQPDYLFSTVIERQAMRIRAT
jgi:hypothetical protein